jgi:hypothetical protein
VPGVGLWEAYGRRPIFVWPPRVNTITTQYTLVSPEGRATLPEQDGKVERSHRIDHEEFWNHQGLRELRAAAGPDEWQRVYNERHERDVDALDVTFRTALGTDHDEEPRELQGPRRPAASHCVPPAIDGGLSGDQSEEELMVEGKGFEPSTSALRTPRSPN